MRASLGGFTGDALIMGALGFDSRLPETEENVLTKLPR